MKWRMLLVCALALVAAACGERIPAQAPELSAQLGLEIQVVRRSHVAAVRQIFRLERDEVNRYFMEVWLPSFASKYFQSPEIAEARQWTLQCPTLKADELLAAERNAGRRIHCEAELLQLITRSAPALQQALEQNRRVILAPLDELEQALIQRIEEKYAEVAAINNSLTTFLTSAADVVKARDRYLAKVGVADEKIDQIVGRVSTLVDDYLEKARGVEASAGEARAFADKAKELTGTLK
jgi:hypothetical protein